MEELVYAFLLWKIDGHLPHGKLGKYVIILAVLLRMAVPYLLIESFYEKRNNEE